MLMEQGLLSSLCAGRPSPLPTARSMSSPTFPSRARDHQASPPAISQHGGDTMHGGLASTMARGMVFAAGSSVGHTAVDAVVSPRPIQHENMRVNDCQRNVSHPEMTTASRGACTNQAMAFQDASKVQLLQSLASFLSCVATTMSFSTEHHSVSAWVGASQVCLEHVGVLQLHELVVQELEDQMNFLSEPSWTCMKQIEESADGMYTQGLNLEIVSRTLLCCIRLLPLVDCFDKNASLASTKMLDSILQQLCSPSELFDLLGLTTLDSMHIERSCQASQGDEDGIWFETMEPDAFEQFPDSASLQNACCEACTAHLAASNLQHRKERIFAILEVYMDEFLLRPDLISRLLSSREDRSWPLVQEQIRCGARHLEASLEAAFVHVLLSLHSLHRPQFLSQTRRKGSPTWNLSLPAGRILLEKFSGEEVPPFYFAHLVHLLAEILSDTTPLDFDQVNELTKTRQNVPLNCQVGGVDWSYCRQERLPKFGLKARPLHTKVLHSETTLNLASSILEHAIQMYMKISLGSDNTGSTICAKLQSSVLNLHLSEYIPFFDTFRKRVRVTATDTVSKSEGTGIKEWKFYRDDCQWCASESVDPQSDYLEDGHGHIGCAGVFHHLDVCSGIQCATKFDVAVENEDVHDDSFLVAVLLQLMSCALECIGREVCKLTWVPHVFGDQFFNGQAMPASESYEADFDEILHCVGLYLSLCIPPATSSCSQRGDQRCGRAAEDMCDSEPIAYGKGSLSDFVGQAIIFFTNILRGEVQKGAPEGILEEYFHLLESLVALLLVLDERNLSRQSTPKCGLGSNCMLSNNTCRTYPEASGYETCRGCHPHGVSVHQLPQDNTTSRFLEEMVLILQGILADLSEQQRSMPEFLLFFIFKQVSKRDGLSLVTMVFNSFLHSHLDVQRSIIQSAEVFWSQGLVTQMLHLALSEPTRSCSLLTFIVYMVDILQDLLPITASLSLSEISDPISWYENIAHSLTLACQLAVSKHRMFVRSGKEQFKSLISKMGEGIDRLLREGTAAVHWLSDLSKTMPESAFHKLTGVWDATGTALICGQNLCGEALNESGNLAKCNSFLWQVDMLRKAVEDLANSGMSLIGSDLTLLLEKGTTFFVALLDLLAGNKLPGSCWSLYHSPHDQHQFSYSECRSHICIESTDLDPGCDCMNGQQQDIQANSDQEVIVDTTEEEVQEPGGTPPSDRRSTGGQVPQSISSSEKSSLEERNDFMDEQEELLDCTTNDDPILAVADILLSSSVVTAEKRQTRSATSLIVQKLGMESNGVGLEKSLSIPNQRTQCSSTTFAIIKRLLQHQSPWTRNLSKSSLLFKRENNNNNKRSTGVGAFIDQVEKTSGQDCVHSGFADDPVSLGGFPAPSFINPYVDSLSGKDPSKDKFDDLKDFIVPKRGRDYSAWFKRRQKVRRRSYNKNFFKRLRQKKELLLLLEI